MIRSLLSPAPSETTARDRSAFLAARDVCRRHARSFYFASHFLPADKRYAAYAVYAFCRMIDDAVDLAEDEAVGGAGMGSKGMPARLASDAASGGGEDASRSRPTSGRAEAVEAALARFEATLDAVYARPPAYPDGPAPDEAALALYAFGLTVRRFGVPKRHFQEMVTGCRMDLTIDRYETWADLERYCYRVAGVVGLIMCPIFGLSDPAAERQAVLMGNAMQLTNILRDVGEDWGRGRLYLPQEDLARFGLAEADVDARTVDDRFCGLMRFEVARARDLYWRGSAGLCHLANDGSRLTAAAMAVVYGGILRAIERQGHDVYRARAHLTTRQKLARLPRAVRLARREAGDPLPDVF